MQTSKASKEESAYFAALDWATDHHDVVVVDERGAIVLQERIEHSAEGWQKLRQRLESFGPALPMAVETNHGLAVEQLLEMGCTVYPVQPKKAVAYRERKAPSGVKNDVLDAWSLADALRVDGHTWRALQPEDPLVLELRLLCRDEVALIEQRTALVNQLQAALREYYPAALEAFEDWTKPCAWALIENFPTPEILERAGKRRWEKFLHTHRLWRPQLLEHRLEIFARARALSGQPAVSAAKSRLALACVKMLRTLESQLDAYRAAIEALFAQHPDSGMFGSLPGAGRKLAPQLLAALGSERERFGDAQALQCYAGSAPVCFQTGKIRHVYIRRACSRPLRRTVHLWADLSRKKCAWAQAYYQAHRAKGQSHATAVRCLGQRWLKILWKMWQTRTCYDESLHLRNQLKHGSWLLTLQPSAA